jgi:uncharacterized protein (TIGR02246 family)
VVGKGWNEIREIRREEFAQRTDDFDFNDFASSRFRSEGTLVYHGFWQGSGMSAEKSRAQLQLFYVTIFTRDADGNAYRASCREMIPTMLVRAEGGPVPALENIKGLSEPRAVELADELNREYEAAYNRPDARALAETFSVDGSGRLANGDEAVGRATLEDFFRSVFSQTDWDRKVELTTNSARFITESLLITDGVYTRIEDPSEMPPRECFFRVSVNENGKWLTNLIMLWLPYSPPAGK